MKHHHARAPEETVLDLPPLVPTGCASRRPPTCLRKGRMPGQAAAEDPSQLAPPEPGLRHSLPNRPARGADPTRAGTIATTRAIEPTTLGVRERPVRPQGADFIGVMGALIVRSAKDQIRPYLI